MQGRSCRKLWAQEGKGLTPRCLASLLPRRQGQAPLPWPGLAQPGSKACGAPGSGKEAENISLRGLVPLGPKMFQGSSLAWLG